jgi:hypothetical protein
MAFCGDGHFLQVELIQQRKFKRRCSCRQLRWMSNLLKLIPYLKIDNSSYEASKSRK